MRGKEGTAWKAPAKPGITPARAGKSSRFPCSRKRCGITPARAGKRETRRTIRRLSWDHPRACGEKFLAQPGIRFCRGSPPRVRGKEGTAWKAPAKPGIIPRVRGKDSDDTHCGRNPGITPARAGKSHQGGGKRRGCRDHPRACGEKTPSRTECPTMQGSPPRVRGKGRCYVGGRDCAGITPARAGKSARRAGKRFPKWDHPRACGEKTPEGLP